MASLDALRVALADRYRLDRELGQGGMATVYRAHDLKHDRDVALKVLKPELAAVIGAERFLSEIKTTANLQHPHILPLFDSGAADSFLFYVMPFIEGESLRDRLNREKQLPIMDAIRIATEVAGALDYAHRHGVIHRDIKPENILLHDGRALVADFGIALAASKAGGSRMTETGMSLGTPTYMSPEQAMGERDITTKSDVYALGCVLYEMLLGEPPFTGPTAQSIVAKVMTEKPARLVPRRNRIPAGVEDAVLTALEKLPADRFASAAAFADALRNPRFDTGDAAARAPSSHGRSRTRGVVVAAAWVVAGATLSAIGLKRWRSPGAAGSAESQQVTYSGRASGPAISPDGRFVAYLETRCPQRPVRGGCVNLQVVEVGSARPVEIVSGADRLSSPRWTHNGLALVVGGMIGPGRTGLFIVPRLGGIPRRIADEPVAYDTHPTADSVALVIAGDSGMALRVIALGSGEFIGPAVPAPLQPLDVAWSRDGRMLAVSEYDRVQVIRRMDGALLSSRDRTLTRAPLRWAADGKSILTFRWSAGQNDDLIAFPVDAGGHLGQPRLVASQLPTLLAGLFDVARGTGRIAIGSGSEFYDIWSFDLAGAAVRAHRLTQGTSWYGAPVLTADGHTLYYLRADPLGNSLYRVVDGRETGVTAERQVVNSSLRLSLDERTITFESRFDSATVLMIHDVASGTSRRVPRRDEDMGWLLSGSNEILWLGTAARSLWITDANGGNRREISIVEAGDRPGALPWWQTNENGYGVWSLNDYGVWSLAPDGKSVALLSGNRDVATVARVPLDSGTVTLLGRFPKSDGMIGIAGWSRDGMIHLARSDPVTDATELLRVDPATGAVRPEAQLPAACHPLEVTFAPAGRRAACLVRERRADLVLFDGFRP